MTENDQEFSKREFVALFFNEAVPFNYKFLFVAVVGLYLIMPLDFLPEGLLGVFGFADDFGVFFGAMQVFTHFANKHLEQLHEEQMNQLPPESQARVYSAQSQAHTAHERAQYAQQQAEEAQYHALDVRQQEEATLVEDGGVIVPSSETPGNDPPKPPPAQRQSPPPPNPPTAPPSREEHNFLHDEWHEQLIAKKRRRTDDEFEELVRRRKSEQGDSDDWDFSRNDPFSRKPKS